MKSQLPSGWELRSLAEACLLLTDGSHFSPSTIAVGYPYITVRDINDSKIDFVNCKFVSKESFDELSKNGCQPLKGDVLFSKDGTVGKVALVEDERDFVVLSSLAIMRPKKELLHSEFLKWVLQSPAVLESALGMKSGTALRRVVLRSLKTLQLPIPPRTEQDEIVRILEEQFSRLDAAAASIAAARRKTDQFRRSLLNFAFDEGLSSRSYSGSGVEGVGRWSTESLRQIASGGLFVDGDWVESKDQDPNGQIRLTQLADVGVGVFKDKSDRWLRKDQAARLGVTFLEENDLLIARMPDPLGRCCVVPKLPSDAVTVVDVAILRIVRTDVDSRFVMWALNSPKMRAAMTKVASGTTRLRISRKNLESIEIPIPVLDEQMKVVEALEDQFSRLEKSLASVDEIERRMSALRRSLLHAAFTGELTKMWREKNNG